MVCLLVIIFIKKKRFIFTGWVQWHQFFQETNHEPFFFFFLNTPSNNKHYTNQWGIHTQRTTLLCKKKKKSGNFEIWQKKKKKKYPLDYIIYNYIYYILQQYCNIKICIGKKYELLYISPPHWLHRRQGSRRPCNMQGNRVRSHFLGSDSPGSFYI